MQNVNEGHSGTKRKKRGLTARKDVGTFAVTTIKVDPMLWAIVGYDERALAIDSHTVLICNSRRHREYMRKVLRNG